MSAPGSRAELHPPEPRTPSARRSVPQLLRAAARRFLALLLFTVAATTAVSLALGLAAGATVSRSLSLGYYLVGAFLLIAGFFVGNRGPVRVKGETGFSMFGIARNRRLRWATGAEQVESLSLSLVFVLLGLVLIVLGAAVDTRYSLV